jgi:WD40 repeat protein
VTPGHQDGQPGPLTLPEAHAASISAVTVVDSEQGPVIITGDYDGALRNWRLDGAPGPLTLPEAHAASISAVTVVDSEQGRVILSASDDGVIMATSLIRASAS